MGKMFSTSNDPRDIAERFAAALDEDDFDLALEALAPACRYLIGDEIIEGPQAIVQSYRKGSDKAKRLFDRVEYGSEVVEVGPDRFQVKFWDRLESAGHVHTYTSKQYLTLGTGGRIVRIEHVEIPGEREALQAFMEQQGISEG